MLLTLSQVLSTEDLAELRALAQTLRWESGARTAGATAREVKHNQQARLDAGAGIVVRQRILDVLRASPLLRSAARPRRFSRLLLSRTGPGGGYGTHIDNATMGSGDGLMRTDVSFTLFLSGPEDYEGGELEVERPGVLHQLKPPAGDLVLYPSTSLHRVAPVTAGERLVAVGWIQSLVPDPAQREVLLDLDNLRAALLGSLDAQSAELLTLQKTQANLLRMWARP